MLNISLAVKRKLVQITAAILTNANLAGFANGEIYGGKLKKICAPGLNCYSCPGAVTSCPLGALQTMIADPQYKMSFYALGFLAAIGLVLGRAVCGWLCPFGLIQEGIYKLLRPITKRAPKIKPPYFLRYAKYLLLAGLVIIAPFFVTDKFGFGAPYFCELICPAGTIEAALPILAFNERLRAMVGALFALKVGVAVAVVTLSAFSERFFCKYACPLGAIYSLFNRFSLIQLNFSPGKCANCGSCEKRCPMGINPVDKKSSAECIRCGKCAKGCPQSALRLGIVKK